jgi:hypothetical protein
MRKSSQKPNAIQFKNEYMVRSFIFYCLVLTNLACPAQDLQPDRKISFSGYEWNVRSTPDKQGPGPNYFSDSCVHVDGLGRLHLLIAKDPKKGRWICPEISTTLKFGYGTYTFVVEGAIDHLDKNIVLGLFNYSGNDGYDEMDIEIARWGNPDYPNLNYTIWPVKANMAKNSATTKEFILKSTLSTHYFRRQADTVICASFDSISTDQKYLIFSTVFAKPKTSVSHLDMPVHINFWLFNGNPPEDEKPVEVIIRSFQFKP